PVAQFKNWIRRYIDEFGFEAGRDFCTFLEHRPDGQPVTEYALTVEMAKALALVERDAVGRQVRQSLIASEERLKQASLSVTERVKRTVQATELFHAFFSIARLIGWNRQAAALRANQAVQAITEVNLLALLGHHLKAEKRAESEQNRPFLGRAIRPI